MIIIDGQGKNDGIVTAPEFQMTPSKSSRSKNELTHASECELCRPINVDGQQQGKKKKREASSISEAHVRDLISLSRLFLPIPSVRIVYPGLVFNTHKKSVENVGK